MTSFNQQAYSHEWEYMNEWIMYIYMCKVKKIVI